MNTEILMPKTHWRTTSLLVSASMISSTVAPFAEPLAPMWWSVPERAVIDSSATENNYAVASIGQAKWMATQALAELASTAPALAGKIDLSTAFSDPPSSPNAAWYQSQKAPLNIGQLKAIAHQFYSKLPSAWLDGQAAQNGIVLTDGLPWNPATAQSENLKLANVGQLKMVFSLRFSENLDGDGAEDLLEIAELRSTQHFVSAGQAQQLKSGEPIVVGDTDKDGLTDELEVQIGSNPNLKDTDGDLINDGDEAVWWDESLNWPRSNVAQYVEIELSGLNLSSDSVYGSVLDHEAETLHIQSKEIKRAWSIIALSSAGHVLVTEDRRELFSESEKLNVEAISGSIKNHLWDPKTSSWAILENSKIFSDEEKEQEALAVASDVSKDGKVTGFAWVPLGFIDEEDGNLKPTGGPGVEKVAVSWNDAASLGAPSMETEVQNIPFTIYPKFTSENDITESPYLALGLAVSDAGKVLLSEFHAGNSRALSQLSLDGQSIAAYDANYSNGRSDALMTADSTWKCTDLVSC